MAKTAIITGGTKGIGYSVARMLREEGYNLLLTYGKDSEAAEAAAQNLNKVQNSNLTGLQDLLGLNDLVKVSVLQADSSDPASIEKIAATTDKADVVVFNAGLTLRTSFEEMTFADWDRVFYANVHFPVFLLQRLLADGKLVSGGSVVFTGSLTGILPHAMSLSYGVTKSAVHALVKNLVKTLSPYGIRVNGVAPGFVDTEWQKNKPAEIRRSIESKIALGRFCSPDELADVYKLLINNPYITGEIIVADGGYSFK